MVSAKLLTTQLRLLFREFSTFTKKFRPPRWTSAEIEFCNIQRTILFFFSLFSLNMFEFYRWKRFLVWRFFSFLSRPPLSQFKKEFLSFFLSFFSFHLFPTYYLFSPVCLLHISLFSLTESSEIYVSLFLLHAFLVFLCTYALGHLSYFYFFLLSQF